MAEKIVVPEWDPANVGIAYVYAAIADHIALRISAGQFKPNMPLPGERALAEEYGVALGTIRRATVELRDRGLVVTLPGRGTFVKPPENTA